MKKTLVALFIILTVILSLSSVAHAEDVSVYLWYSTSKNVPDDVPLSGSVKFIAFRNYNADDIVLTEESPEGYIIRSNGKGRARSYLENFKDENGATETMPPLISLGYEIHVTSNSKFKKHTQDENTSFSNPAADVILDEDIAASPTDFNTPAVVTANSVSLSWGADPDATYKVYRRKATDAVAGCYQLKADNISGASCTDNDVETGVDYQYLLVSVKDGQMVHGAVLEATPQASPLVLESIEVSTTDDPVKAAQEATFTVTASYNNGSTADVTGSSTWQIVGDPGDGSKGTLADNVYTAPAVEDVTAPITVQIRADYSESGINKYDIYELTVNPADITSVTVSSDELEPGDKVTAGSQYLFTVTADAPFEASDVSNWTSSAGSVDPTSGSKTTTFTAPTSQPTNNKVTVTAIVKEKTGQKEVNWIPNDLTVLIVLDSNENESGLELQGGATHDFDAKGKDTYNNEWNVTDASWDIDQAAKNSDASINASSGFLTVPVAFPDTQNITVTALKNGVSDNYVVDVIPPELTNVTVTSDTNTIKAGKTMQFTATADAPFDAADVSWSSGAGSIDPANNSKTTILTAPATDPGGDHKIRTTATVKGVSGYKDVTWIHGDLNIIEITDTISGLQVGQTHDFNAIGKDDQNNTWDVDPTWDIDQAAKDLGASISSNGVLTAPPTVPTSGKVTVYASINGESDSHDVNISENPADDYTINASSSTLVAGETLDLSISANGAYDAANIIWVAEPDIGSFTAASGVDATQYTVGALNDIGSVTIKFKYNSVVEDFITISLVAGDAAAITIQETGLKVVVGETADLTVVVTDSQGNKVSGPITWTLPSSEDTSGGAKIENGHFTAPTKISADGKVTVNALAGSIEDTVEITILPDAAVGVQLVAEPEKVEAGGTIKISTASVDQYGNVVKTLQALTTTAQTNVGTQTFEMEVDGIKGSVTVVVEAGPAHSITVSPEKVNIETGESVDFTVKLYDAYDNLKETKVVTYTNVLPGAIDWPIELEGLTATVKITALPKINAEDFKIVLSETDAVINNFGETPETGTLVAIEAKDIDGNPVNLVDFGAIVKYSVTGDKNSIDASGNLVVGDEEGTFVVTTTLTIGDKTLTSEKEIYVNLGAPKIKVNSPDGAVELVSGKAIAAKPEFDLVLTDGNGIAKVDVYIDNVKISATPQVSDVGANTHTYSYRSDVTLASGTHTMRIEVTDSLGTKSVLTLDNMHVYADLTVTGIPMNYPNPFRPAAGEATKINYNLTQDADVLIRIYDLAGRQVQSITCNSGAEGGRVGENNVEWNGQNAFGQTIGNGVYYFFITSDGKVIGKGEMAVAD